VKRAGWLLLWLGATACQSARDRGLLVVELPSTLALSELQRIDAQLTRRLGESAFAVQSARVDARSSQIAFTLDAPAAARANELRSLVERTGALRLVPIVDPDAAMAGAADEREGMLQWRGSYPEGDPERYHLTPSEQGGPAEALRWYEDCDARRPWVGCHARDALFDPQLSFTELDLELVASPSSGEVVLRLEASRREALRSYARRLVGVPFALVDDERIVVARVTDVTPAELVIGWDCPRVPQGAALTAWRAAARTGRLAARPRVLEIR